MKEHCATDDHVKAVICHEFLHVLLCHTEDKRPLTPARHLAFDAVINAIIHRTFGPSFSSMMGKYYAEADDIRRILRPMNSEELRWSEKFRSKLPDWVRAWEALYGGLLVADDIEALAETAGQGGWQPHADEVAGSVRPCARRPRFHRWISRQP